MSIPCLRRFLQDHPYGYFADPVTLVPVASSVSVTGTDWCRGGNYRDMILVRDVAFVAPDGIVWRAFKDDIINGLSTPRFFWRFAPPYIGKAREASVIHDSACQRKGRPSQLVHKMFYQAMRANGVNRVSAFLRWAAVRLFGPRF